MDNQEPIRIAKAIASYGYCSRRDAEKLIEQGVVYVNDVLVEHPSMKVGKNDKICIDGKLINAPEESGIWLYHKPRGLIVTHKDPEGRKTIFESLPKHLPRLVSVGRLDINSEGLMILTNSPSIAHYFEDPKNEFERIYKVRVFGKLDERKLLSLNKGITIEGIRYKPIKANIISSTKLNSWIEFRIKEGKNREIRKIVEYLGLRISRLIRISYGPFDLGNIEPGKIIKISDKILFSLSE